MRRFFIAFWRNPISLGGAGIAAVSALVILTLVALEFVGFRGGAYAGILAFLILPAFFLLGLLLVPIGIVRQRRLARRARAAGEPHRYPVLDFNDARTRTLALIFLGLTFVNVVVLAAATFKGVEVMDSTEFCGTACHTVMEPEFTAYQTSPHARVKCAACHIGPGADWFVQSKLSGAWQLVAVTFNLYPRPIPTPVHNLRPARETCEQCHWPSKFVGNRLKVKTHYDDDETSTELTTALLLRVGGHQNGRSEGIHWHVDPGVAIRYRSDPSREVIYDVELTRSDGSTVLYRNSEPGGDESTEWRQMDCVDCHNRPTHIYRLPDDAVDEAVAAGRIDRALPFVRREAIAALQADYPSREAAAVQIRERLLAFYRTEHADDFADYEAPAQAAAEALAEIWGANVFPAMNVAWGTYPDHIGHEKAPGCFRCHNDEHESESGDVISQDCDVCHVLLAMEEEDPEILSTLEL